MCQIALFGDFLKKFAPCVVKIYVTACLGKGPSYQYGFFYLLLKKQVCLFSSIAPSDTHCD